MNILTAIIVLMVVFFVAMYVLTFMSKRHLFLFTTAAPITVLEACDAKLSRFFWRRVDGPGHLNCRYRFHISVRGSQPPVVSISADPSTQVQGTEVQVWMSSASTQYGMINMCERVVFAKWSLGRAVRALA